MPTPRFPPKQFRLDKDGLLFHVAGNGQTLLCVPEDCIAVLMRSAHDKHHFGYPQKLKLERLQHSPGVRQLRKTESEDPI